MEFDISFLWQDLLKDDCALLKELNIPEQIVEDAARFCEEQQASLKKKRELVKFYEEDRRLLEVSWFVNSLIYKKNHAKDCQNNKTSHLREKNFEETVRKEEKNCYWSIKHI